ncbi:RNA ligase, partial [Cognatiyoonia sp. IB215182]|uniref:RNA ligase n=1 Tax=Cognatiyoonia sp. IB215182 TaxID=3097353 RepID=UPI002A0EDED1
RPFHKFFNLGEKRLPQDEPWDQPHLILDKLDGSMIHPALVDGEMAFMTRMGITDHGRTALTLASGGVRAVALEMLEAGFTAIFEYTGPENRIVVLYDKPELTLLAIREIRTGFYLSMEEITRIAAKHDVPVVQSFGQVEDVASFMRDTRALEGLEGYVIAFEDGHRIKIKADLYALQHKALSDLSQEKNLLGLIAKDSLDDVMPLLAEDIAAEVRGYNDQIMASLKRLEVEITGFVEENRHLERRDFAAKAKAELDRTLQSVAFRALDGTPPRRGLMEILERASASENKVDAIRPLFGMAWSPSHAMK